MTSRVLALVAASALTLPAAALGQPQVTIAPSGPVVELSVHETIDVAPDTATISAGVTSEAQTATEALRLNSVQMQQVIERIKSLGIPARDIQTAGINLNPRYDYDQPNQRPVFRGYQASNRVSVTLRKIAETGRILDALVAAGATDLNGPSFSVADDTAAKDQARSRAVARANAQAQAYAATLGFGGTRVLAVSESMTGGPVAYEMKTRNLAAQDITVTAAPVEPGMVSTGVTVTITYELTGAGAAGRP